MHGEGTAATRDNEFARPHEEADSKDSVYL